MDAIRDAREVSQRRPRGELNPRGGGGGALHMKFSRDAAIPRIPAPHLLKQGQLQLAGASFRDEEFELLQPRPGSRSLIESKASIAQHAPRVAVINVRAHQMCCRVWR